MRIGIHSRTNIISCLHIHPRLPLIARHSQKYRSKNLFPRSRTQLERTWTQLSCPFALKPEQPRDETREFYFCEHGGSIDGVWKRRVETNARVGGKGRGLLD